MKSLDGKVVLIVEDDDLLRESMIEVFKLFGARCVEARNGLHALKQASQGIIDIILTDIKMPGGDGLEFIRNLQKAENHRMIFVYTGYYNADDDEVQGLNIARIFEKPMSSQKLIDEIIDHLSHQTSLP